MPVSKPYLRAAHKHTVVGLGFYLVQKRRCLLEPPEKTMKSTRLFLLYPV